MDNNNIPSILKNKNEGFDANRRTTRAARKNQIRENVLTKDPAKKVSWKEPELVEIFILEDEDEERGNVAKDVFMKTPISSNLKN